MEFVGTKQVGALRIKRGGVRAAFARARRVRGTHKALLLFMPPLQIADNDPC
jgi:hypothetical protein